MAKIITHLGIAALESFCYGGNAVAEKKSVFLV